MRVVSSIPKGPPLSYKEVARNAGNENSARAVGNILNKNYNPDIPCHRVIKSDGSIGGYNKGVKEKIKKLQGEAS